METKVRVRFAPSPTGPLHIGGVRTALFNFLFAKKHGGDFVLRIEDTDQNRYVEGAEDYIVESLNWCGIPFDEGPGKERENGPYRQSERKAVYRKYAEKLVENGYAYYAFDTAETLDFHRKDHEAKGKTFIYNWHNRLKLKNSLSLSKEEVEQLIQNGDEYVIRFKSPENETILLNDLVRGEITIDTSILDDKVLFKSDGMPTYHLANIVDDHLMEITHVIRGEEWLPSLALHYMLYRSFGWEAPIFAHLPLILKPSGKGKLSKRDGDALGFPVFPLEWRDPKNGDIAKGFREEGYLPEALINFLAFLGWNPGTEQEIFSIDELVEAFSFDKVNKAGSRFDPDKVKWFNHHYIQNSTDVQLAKILQSSRAELKEMDPQYIELVAGLVKERANLTSDLWDLTRYFFKAPRDYDETAIKKAIKDDTATILSKVRDIVVHLHEFTKDNIESQVKEWIKTEGLGFGKVMMPLRVALVGSLQGIDVFEIMFLIGKNESVSRIEKLIQSI
ncbi:glutamate--tRNA ligase [Aegicerativicinus sediminis]|uniref:glutamate--tRNA ligase n=1 Tax=Aegicerativicinus sediminis TaxID=2893202 RepID=UPI001E34DB4B|nr:glutamate--tRNA ligase [Aegicerativicinus sediminis]